MRIAVVLTLLLVLAVVGCGGQGAGEDMGSYAAPPRPPLEADPDAGPPALLVHTGRDTLVLDARARIRRVLYLSEMTSVCPGGRALADAPDTSAYVEVVSLTGKRRWRKRIPRGSVYHVVCLDPKGERVVVVMNKTFPDDDDPQIVHLVERRRDRTLEPAVVWTASITPTRLYESLDDGFVVRELPSLEPLRTYAAVPSASWVHVSPDERWVALTTLGVNQPNVLTLLDLSTGATREIARGRDVQVAGWLGPDQLVLHERDEIRILGPDLAVRERLEHVKADGVQVIDGALIATHRARVYTLRGPSPFTGGTLPESVSVLGSLAAP
jgi:hypothetical protein